MKKTPPFVLSILMILVVSFLNVPACHTGGAPCGGSDSSNAFSYHNPSSMLRIEGFDSSGNPTLEIGVGETVTLNILRITPPGSEYPLVWTISGNCYELVEDPNEPDTCYVTLDSECQDPDCVAEVTITESGNNSNMYYGRSIKVYIRKKGGQWVVVEDCCDGARDGIWVTTKDEGYRIINNDWCAGDCGTNCMGNCNGSLPFPGDADDSPCHVEAARVTEWQCE